MNLTNIFITCFIRLTELCEAFVHINQCTLNMLCILFFKTLATHVFFSRNITAILDNNWESVLASPVGIQKHETQTIAVPPDSHLL